MIAFVPNLALEIQMEFEQTGNLKERGVVTLCGGQGCCPTIDFTQENKVLIRDDFGGSIQLTHEQWADLKMRFVA